MRLRLQKDLDEKKHVLEMERLTKGRIRPINSKDQNSYSVANTPKIPAFDENLDEMDSYLFRSERYATAQRWKRDQWATILSTLLKGKALDVHALMPVEQALDYDMLKAGLLKRYKLTEEGFKRRYKKCGPDSGETFQQFTSRLKS